MDNERLKIWIGFWKWFVSGVLIAGSISIISVMMGVREKEIELQIKVSQQEQEYLNSFLEHALQENIGKRLRFAQYFAIMTTSKEQKEAWKKYLNIVKNEKKETEKEIESIEKSISGKDKDTIQYAKLEINKLKRKLEAFQESSVENLNYSYHIFTDVGGINFRTKTLSDDELKEKYASMSDEDSTLIGFLKNYHKVNIVKKHGNWMQISTIFDNKIQVGFVSTLYNKQPVLHEITKKLEK